MNDLNRDTRQCVSELKKTQTDSANISKRFFFLEDKRLFQALIWMLNKYDASTTFFLIHVLINTLNHIESIAKYITKCYIFFRRERLKSDGIGEKHLHT